MWKLYYDRLGQTEIPTKVAAGMSGELADGNNTFYIVVSTQDETQSNLYTLTVYRSYEVSIWYSVLGDLKKTDKVYTGYEYTVNYPLEVDGYRFVGWKDEKGALTTRFTPMGNVRLTAALEPLRYTVTLDADGGTCNTKKTTVTFAGEYAFPVPQKEGHTFVGWYDGDQRLTDEKGKSLAPWSIAKNTQVVAKYTANQNTVNIISNERICAVSGAGIYAYGTKVTVSVTPYLGGTFLGWYRGETKLSEKLQYTFTMGDEKVALQAKMQLAEGLKDLDFEATETTLTITGIHSGVTEITIPNSVTSISRSAFSGCTGLTSIVVESENSKYHVAGNCLIEIETKALILGCKTSVIPSDGSVERIGTYAFKNCTELMSVTIPDSVTSIDDYAFSGCTGLTSIAIPNGVTRIGEGAFSGCSSLESITLPFVGGSKKNASDTYQYPFGYIFGTSSYTGGVATEQHYYESNTSWPTYSTYYIPESLKSVTINGENILYGAFFNCTGLTSITIGNSVTSIGYSAFRGCTGLTSITIPFVGATKDGTDNVRFGYIFGVSSYSYNSGSVPSSLKTVVITGGMSIGSFAFEDCTGLTSIEIPDSVQNIGKYAFYKCTNLKTVIFAENSQCSSIGEGAFSGCSSLESMTLPFVGGSRKSASDTYQYPFGYIFGESSYTGGVAAAQYYYGSNTSSTTYDTYYIPEGLKSVTITGGNILYGAFYNCTGLTSITIPNSVTSIGSSAFYGCTGLTGITIPNSVTSISRSAFEDCTELTNITIPDSVTYIGVWAFHNCTGLTGVYITDLAKWCAIDFGSSDANPLTYAHNLYLNGSLVIEFEIPKDMTNIGDYVFSGCTGLTSIEIPNSVTSIGWGAFSGCTGLTSITIPNSVTCIKDFTFYGCTGLTSIEIPNSVTSIGWGAFSGCTGLTSITIPNSVTSIGSYAFRGCTGLTSITIPVSVTYIGGSAFERCDKLNTIYYEGSETEWKALIGTKDIGFSGTVVYNYKPSDGE